MWGERDALCLHGREVWGEWEVLSERDALYVFMVGSCGMRKMPYIFMVRREVHSTNNSQMPLNYLLVPNAVLQIQLQCAIG